ncbi:hypothetical protein MN032_10900 [Agromyces atrinae]|uniref:hypothetical protein n=1 Tax=Agromyces atrinae TaxID=592376 RepID=UPI001F56718A|nr:hypothetical protein [Agromyces atrinae]MCI2958205.1 hypothetical protein [Agromyces atrinae]
MSIFDSAAPMSAHATLDPARTPFVVGLDLSLTATGYASIRPQAPTRVQTIKSKGAKDATLAQRAERLHALSAEILGSSLAADIVVIEQPAYNQTGGSHHDRSGLWWLVTDALVPIVERVIEVTPPTLKKYATGKGNASKDEVLAAVIRRYPDIEVTNNNEADALVLAAVGARLAGHPIEASLPAANLAALEKVRWSV